VIENDKQTGFDI